MPLRKTANKQISQRGSGRGQQLVRISEHHALTEHVDDFRDEEDVELAKKRQQFFFKALRRTIRSFRPVPVKDERAAKKRLFRKTKRLRPCAKHAMFWIPLFVLIIESYVGYILKVEHVTEAYYDQLGYEPWMIDKPPRVPVDIQNLTTIGSSQEEASSENRLRQCKGDLRWIGNHHNPWYHYSNPSRRQIPAMIHQTNKDRCLTMNFARASQKWSAFSHKKWSYYLHDEYALAQLFLEMKYPEFPHLHLVVENCLLYQPQVQKNLWSYLVLWIYGGVVADVNSMPDKFHVHTIQKDDDAIFVFDVANQRLNTTFFATSPKHPVMYYAIQHSLWRILMADDIASPDLVFQSGPEALLMGLKQFSGEDIQDWSALPRTLKGAEQPGRSAKVISSEEKYATQIFISPKGIMKEFGKMGVEVGVIQPLHGDGGRCFSKMHANLDKFVDEHQNL